MGLISGIPNFFSSANPVADDFNNAVFAILSQIGGTCYNPSTGQYATLPGNLNSSQNITGTLHNSQKAEANSFFTATMLAFVSGGVFTSTAFFGPFAVDCTITCINLTARAGDYYISGGRFSVFLNNDTLTTFTMGGGGGSSVAGFNGECSSVSTNIPVRAGDFITIDPLNTSDTPASPLLFSNAARVQNVSPATVSPTSDLNISLFMTSQHVR